MTDSKGTLDTLLDELMAILSSLELRLSPKGAPAFFASIGVPLTAPLASSISGALGKFTSNLAGLTEAVAKMNVAAEASDEGVSVDISATGLTKLAGVINSLASVSTAIGGLGIPGVTQTVVADLPRRILADAIARYLGNQTLIDETLEFTGILERDDFNVDSTAPDKPFYTVNTFHFDRLGGWLADPTGQLKSLYGWGSPGFNGKQLLGILDKLVAQLGLPTLYNESAIPPELDLIGLRISPKTDATPKGLLIALDANLKPTVVEQSGPDWSVTLASELGTASGTTILIQPPAAVTVTPAEATTVSGQMRAAFTMQRPPEHPIVLLGVAGAGRIEVGEISAFTQILLKGSGTQAKGELSVGGGLKGGKVIIDTSEADGFLAKILPDIKIENSFDLDFDYSAAEGLHFHGSSTLEIQLASHIDLGPIELKALTLSVGLDEGKFPLAISTDLKANLGPLVAVIEGLGLEAAIALMGDNSGNLGPIDIQPGFLPPKGVGLSLDAGLVRGGGYLFFDSKKEEYAGALELDISGLVTAKAIGLITTRMPDGSKGFSLLIIITAEFATGIQLGFGFTLLAVGGLLGLNRTMQLEPLMEGIRTGAVESIMFPKDVIANAPKIISDLRTFFPPEADIFLIGPMAKIGWGTPTLISLSLGIIIEIPGNIAILGVLKVALPTDDLAILVLQINFAGAIEFDKKRIYFFAALFESRVLFITIEGEMGLLMAFGDDANFVVSVGGFHPRFDPPPLPFPTPRRIAVSLVNSSAARVRIEGYFAVTSNTAQFGSRVEIFFGLDDFNVKGHLAFDALFQFSPFYFIVEMSGSFGVTVFGFGLFSVSVDLALEGPTPWRARGTGEISVLMLDFDVDFHVTWGEKHETTLPPIAVMPIALAEFSKANNWRALLPEGNNLLVTLRTLPAEEAAFVLHPVGVLRVSQRALPLELTLDKVGNQKPNDVKRLAVAVQSGGLAKRDDVFEQFAPAQFQDMKNAEKLSRPAFGPERGGLEMSAAGEDMASSQAVRRVVRYELVILDTNYKRFVRRFARYPATLFNFFLAGASVSSCPVSKAQKKLLQPFDEKITLQSEGYGVAFQSNNKAYAADAASFASEAGAREYLQQQLAADPNLAGTLHVIPGFEMAA